MWAQTGSDNKRKTQRLGLSQDLKTQETGNKHREQMKTGRQKYRAGFAPNSE